MKKTLQYILPVFLLGIMIAIVMTPMTKSSLPGSSTTLKSGERPGEAWSALQFISTSRAYPEQDIPEDAYHTAYSYTTSRFSRPENQPLSVLPWQNIGPNNVGGRTIGIAIDPSDTSVIWMGSASGGLWKSTTGGTGINAWTQIPTGYPVRGISCIAIDPVNHDIMYIGTGETYSYGTSVNGLVTRPTRGSVGIGILKSVDRGVTWFPSLNWQYNQLRGIWDIVINPLLTSEVYAATTEGVYKSTNGGTTWTQQLNQPMVMNLVIDPVDTNTLYAGVGNVNSALPGIYRTTNSGTTWNRLTIGLPPDTNKGRITIIINPQNHLSVLALIADLYSTIGIYRSFDKGQTWNSINGLTEIVTYQGWYAKGLAFKQDDSTRVIFGGVYLFRSDLSGDFPYLIDTINYTVHPDIHGVIQNPLDPSMIYVITDGGLYRSDDFGDNFYDCNDGYVTSQAYIGSVSHQDGSIMLSGLQDNSTILYNGTNYWTPVIGGDGSFNAIDPGNDQIMYGSYQYLNIYKSNNQGQNFFMQLLSQPASAFGGNTSAFIAPFILCPSNTNVLYAGGDSLFYSNNGGNNWTTPSNAWIDNGNVALSIAVSSTNKDSVYVCTAPGIGGQMHVFRSGNHGTSLTNISAGLPNRYPRDLAVNPHNSRMVYVAYSGFGAGHIFKSIDAGTNWTDISTTLPDVPFHCITIDPSHPDTLFAGSDLGIFVSVDGGINWDAYNNGLQDGTMVFDIQFSPADNSIVAFTFGNGTYKVSQSGLPVGIAGTNFTSKPVLNIIGNPVTSMLRAILYCSRMSPVILKIFDMNGRIVKQIPSENFETGNHDVQLNIEFLTPGSYLLEAEQGTQVCVKKFIKL